jgi:ribosomal-protein-alanine N-acetyltransferase
MPGMFRIRNFKASDLPAVLKIAQFCFTEGYSASQFMQLYEAYPDYFIVVENVKDGNKAVIGFIICVIPAPTQARILLLAVNQSYRRKGVGSALLTALLQRLNVNITKITLEVKTGNLEAIQMYVGFGFNVTSLLPRYYKDNQNAYVMEKSLV